MTAAANTTTDSTILIDELILSIYEAISMEYFGVKDESIEAIDEAMADMANRLDIGLDEIFETWTIRQIIDSLDRFGYFF